MLRLQESSICHESLDFGKLCFAPTPMNIVLPSLSIQAARRGLVPAILVSSNFATMQASAPTASDKRDINFDLNKLSEGSKQSRLMTSLKCGRFTGHGHLPAPLFGI